MTTVQELIDELPGAAEAIPLPFVRGIISDRLGPWPADAQSYAVRSGAIRVLPQRAEANAYVVDRSEAVLILIAAVLAFAAGVAVVAMIRAVKISGVDPAMFIQAGQQT